MAHEKKKSHTLLKIAGGAALTAAAAYTGISAYVFREAFDLQKSSLYSAKGGTAYLTFTDEEKSQWYEHSVKTDDFITSFDGLKLHALRMENHKEAGKYILFALGPGKYNHNILDYLYEFDHAGYNVLALDSRGCGKSEGKYCTLGWSEHYDVISWVNYLINIRPDCEIVLFGISIGANAVMNALGDYMPKNVIGAVAEGGFSEMKEFVRGAVTEIMQIDGKLILPGVNLLMKQFLHFSLYDVSTARQLAQASVPVLFIGGGETQFTNESMLFDNYYACGSRREVMTAEDAEKNYFTKIFDFIDSVK